MLKEMLEKLAELPDDVWDIYGMRHEPLLGKIKETEKTQFLQLAHETGSRLAAEYREKFPGAVPCELAEKLGLTVHLIEGEECRDFTMFACYTEPNLIELYQETMENAETLLKEEECSFLFGSVKLSDILLAHELFHYLEYMRPELPTNRRLLNLWNLGGYVHKSKVLSLNEIAAMTFAKELLELPCSPYVLDILLLYGKNQEMAMELYEYVMDVAEKEELKRKGEAE